MLHLSSDSVWVGFCSGLVLDNMFQLGFGRVLVGFWLSSGWVLIGFWFGSCWHPVVLDYIPVGFWVSLDGFWFCSSCDLVGFWLHTIL